MAIIKNVTIGSDPELFLEKNGEIISAEGLIGGTKKKPKPISESGHAVQEDNVMIEFNIPPANNVEEFVNDINYCKDYLETICKLYGPEFKLNYSSSAELNDKYLQTIQAREFGCEPDYNNYEKLINVPPNPNTNLRTCGGHIAVGYDNPNQNTTENIVYAMDMILGLQSVIMDPDDRRKEMYGKAGCFRPKKFGVEYRTLSNFWIKNDDLINWAYESTQIAIDLINLEIIDDLVNIYGNQVREAIDTNNKRLASSLINNIMEARQEKIKQKEKNLITK